MQVISFSEKGHRVKNEDFILSEIWDENTSLHLIADGMGGYEHGEIAAETVAREMNRFLKENLSGYTMVHLIIQDAVNHANLALLRLRNEYKAQMGTTIAGILFINEQVYCFWLGDVRIYHLREKRIIFQSKDHSLVNELMEQGRLFEHEEILRLRHIVSKAVLGETGELIPDRHVINDLSENDILIVCSDGMHNVVDAGQMEVMIQTTDLNTFCDRVKVLCEKEGSDNYSMILITGYGS